VTSESKLSSSKRATRRLAVGNVTPSSRVTRFTLTRGRPNSSENSFIAAGVGWVVGVVLLWRSRAWTTTDKLIGTLVLPGGLFATLLLLLLALGRSRKVICTSYTRYATSVVHCTHGPSSGPSTLASIALVLLALTPIATAVYLARRAR